jgi:CheY-like chemotaxis protein
MNAEATILIVEDNPDDVFFMRRACKAANIQNPIQVAADGQEAIEYLAGEGKFSDRKQFPVPCLVLLDLKLPRKTGQQVLTWIRHQRHYATLIVIALTTSREPKDISSIYGAGANAYLVKPSSPAALAEMMTAIRAFWISQNVVE